MHRPPSGTVTLLFTDIQGSTQLWQRHPQAMPGALAAHHGILRQAAGRKRRVIDAVQSLASLALRRSQPERAARLLAAAAANAEAMRLKIESELQRPFDQTLRAARVGMAEVEFQAHWEDGRSLSLDEAVNLTRTGPA